MENSTNLCFEMVLRLNSTFFSTEHCKKLESMCFSVMFEVKCERKQSTSKSIQNELIAVIGKVICNKVIDEVKEAKFYSVIADEVTDAANRKELSLVLRYVVDDDIKEMFLHFIEVERMTGRDLGMAILNWLKTHGNQHVWSMLWWSI